MGKFKNLSGLKFGKLTVLELTEKKDKHGGLFWRCQCDCGNCLNVVGGSLKSGNTKSCGCLHKEAAMREFVIDRTGETRVMNNGLSATIIAYRDCEDIDIQFENCEIVRNKRHDSFRNGEIKCPMLFEYIDDYVKVTNPNTKPTFSFLIDVEDVPLVSKYWWSNESGGYARGFADNKKIMLHRLIMNAPDDMDVDHINGNRADCRKRNLRICAHAENMRNYKKPVTNTSGYKGVTRHKRKRWKATIRVEKKRIHIGCFADAKDAARAYNEAAIKYHGEFARLNDI